MARPDSALPSLFDTAARLSRGEISPVELTQATLRAVEKLNPTLNAYITVLETEALTAARTAEREISSGHYRGPLHGIPVSVKDLYYTQGIRTTAGSRILAQFVPTENATVVTRLRAAGAVLVAKANTMEFAYASVHPDYGPPKNPWDVTKGTGGSSSGSAAAVTAGLDFGSFGSDTGGSIRIPAAFCGITGLKPTYGRISRFGLVPLAWTLDHPGPLARSVRDIAILLHAVAGPDPLDTTTATRDVPDYPELLDERLDGITLAVLTNFMGSDVDPEIRTAVERAMHIFADAGARVREISIPELERDALEAQLQILLPEASYCHREWLEKRSSEYTASVRTRLQAGTRTPAVAYIAAKELRERIRERLRSIQQDLDLLALPTIAIVAPSLDVYTATQVGEEGLKARTRRTSPFNLVGQPALSLPCGFSSQGLPIGLQLVGRDFEESCVLRAGHAFQLRTDWHLRRPPVAIEVWP